MDLPQRSFRDSQRKDKVLRKIEDRAKPFDVETTFAEVSLQRKKQTKKYRGPDSLLYAAIYPVACIMKLFGVAPYDFTGDQMTPSNASLVFCFSFLALYSYIMYIVFLRFISLKRDKPILAVVETTKVRRFELFLSKFLSTRSLTGVDARDDVGDLQLLGGDVRAHLDGAEETRFRTNLERSSKLRREARPAGLSDEREENGARGVDSFDQPNDRVDPR